MRKTGKGSGQIKHPARVQFIREHKELWDLSAKEVVSAMKRVGLLSLSTNWGDVNVDRIIAEAKGLENAKGTVHES